ncbi:23S rRNA (guanosine(2251)-2'-O)-methyltransferase RlmB [Lepagella muris]|jgi:23S rRNA (guanosine2251-2'-O)-methyltransferase|uniref:23S rRNA (Guanosine(2251)-2'-O)-methyltransferase RlmB n=1 Tax=Lepagella muris TaxID=3032870 RepID=A0AC61RGG2_9BACT|nr:23S rRNA (guanosine(2251)-2'-O)-methyltransferase RlmB [Lepagella muris]ROT03992.1 23S rRNA (guanosine(2251)-2'-O)-methyltransferase RlmB [Muribaculaceae bacterium Isolate-037 (Harlan)]TGY78434.1 23S rRNA (guanosine(2251)-2'-O)-methyltransferase RlmB [Lepagella muris]THG53646.1 23S rRNA (guanosine(2251)-2'-O)-methyltransferase RlmB [Bacteroidales bacterium]TKC66149.1 23S rRNA (guanosine(2251)-2'-O)-methyltransferase RlmB [Bacteroidales bacterium]
MEKNDYIFGIRAILEAIESGKTIDKVLIRRDLGGELAKELLDKVREYDIVVQRVPLERLNRITMKNHQGAIAQLSPVGYHRLDNIIPQLYEDGKIPFALVLDGVTDARNFGAIARSADCAGVDFIVVPERGSASVTSDAVKASAGALFYVPVCRERDTLTAVKKLKENGYLVVGASEKGAQSYIDADYTVPVAIVMGSEDTGISPEVLRQCDRLAAIPILGNIGSLNVSVAAGVILYEAVRQRLASGFSKQ